MEQNCDKIQDGINPVMFCFHAIFESVIEVLTNTFSMQGIVCDIIF